MKFIIGKKIDMTQIWQGSKVMAVTKVEAGPCPVIQMKSKNNDGYEAVQLGFGERKEKNIKKPQRGHLKNVKLHLPAQAGMSRLPKPGTGGQANVKCNAKFLREFRTNDENLKVGDVIDVGTFAAGDKVMVSGISKGKGFQGVVRRHYFHGQDKTHGNKDQLRMPGSIGATGPAHVFKGTRMPGQMGRSRATVKNLEIVKIDNENNFLFIKGAVPGARNSLVLISGEGELKIKTPNQEEVEKSDMPSL